MYRIAPSIRNFALALLAGILTATLWVNLAPGSYYDVLEWRLADLVLPSWIWAGSVTMTPLMIVTDILMAGFFFVIGKELWEALTLERGALHGRRAVAPLGLVVGGMIGAALVWLWLSQQLETAAEAVPGGGWPVPLGSDTVIICLLARLGFGRGHPALHLVLLLAIATDILALLVLGLANPHLSVRLVWLVLPLGAALSVWWLYGRGARPGTSERRRRAGARLWPYVLAGAISWFGTAASGMPAALGLLPMIPAIAHATRSFGLFAEAEGLLQDPLNRLTRLAEPVVIVVIFLFGLIRGGVDLAALAPTSWITLGALWIGRPAGLLIAGLILSRIFGYRLPPGMTRRDTAAALMFMAMGFTVPAVAIDASLPGGAMQEAARLGLVVSLLAGLAGVAFARASGAHLSQPGGSPTRAAP